VPRRVIIKISTRYSPISILYVQPVPSEEYTKTTMLFETIMISVPDLSVSSLLLQDGDFIQRETIVIEEGNTFHNKREARELYLKREMVLSQLTLKKSSCTRFPIIQKLIEIEMQAYHTYNISIHSTHIDSIIVFFIAHSLIWQLQINNLNVNYKEIIKL